MAMDSADAADAAGGAYLQHLTESDLRLLVGADSSLSSERAERAIAAVRSQPALILAALDRPSTAEQILNLGDPRAPSPGAVNPGAVNPRLEQFTVISPFLVFAAAIHRTAADLAGRSYRVERASARMRIPLFDSADLVGYLAQPWNRFFLAQLLASYARVSSGVSFTRTARGLQRRRWNDLDPVRLAMLLDEAPPAQRPGVWRRMGDCALFLTGMFPDHVRRTGLGASTPRLARLSGLGPGSAAAAPPDDDALPLLEWLGAQWYRLAADRAMFQTRESTLLRQQAQSFDQARSVLNAAADRYLFPIVGDWLAPA